MIIKKLPTEIQSLLTASSKIINYKNAVEELVYNSLDADATSVAVRIHVYENVIQVIDNGFGIAKCDIPLMGERYASSKVTGKSSFKSAPVKFGFRGVSLSNIIEVSECVKITTRHKDSDETWVKIFYKGHHKDSQVTSMRPSKGTTVEVKGFLYNLHIQKKATNPLNELQNIKLLLQQLSLVNTNVSISLRDDSKNEILFKIHKNRDVYQTLSSVYEIDKKDLQELQIEKHQYKAIGFISKQNSNISPYQWIYLNGRFLNKCHLHDIINNSFTKNKQLCRNMKTKNNYLDFEKKLQNIDIPSYFIFITCPHLDYNINRDSTKTITEFKDWKQIRELLEKLVQFYKGDIKLQKLEVSQSERKNKIDHTREEVRKIIEKVLGNKTKGHKMSQLRKGVKGKIVKKKKNPNLSSMKQFINMHKVGKKSKVSDHTPKENLSSLIEAPMSMKFSVSIKNTENANNLIVKRFFESIKAKGKNKPRLNVEPIIQHNKKEKTGNIYTTYQEFAEPSYLSDFNENTSLVIEDTAKDNNLYVARNKKTSIKDKSFKRKREKQKSDPVMKQYMRETALELYSEKIKKKKCKINEIQDKNAYIFDAKGDASFLQYGNNIHTFYEHKLAFNGITPLNRVGKDYLKSSDLLKTILNSQKVYSKENIVQFKKHSENEHKFYEKRLVHRKDLVPPIDKRNNCNIVNDKMDRNIDELLDIDYSSYIRKQTDNLRNVQKYFENKYSDIEKDMIHVQNECELTSNLDQCDRHNNRNTQVNGIETNISTTQVYKSLPKLTFESHKYNLNDAMMRNNTLKRFISKQSKENFNLHNNQHTNITSINKSHFIQHYNNKNKRKQSYKHPYLESIKKVPNFEHKSTHTIEFSTNNMYNANQNTTLEQWKYKITGNVQNTYTIMDSNVSLNIENYLNNLNNNATLNQEASYLRYNLSSAKLTEEKEETHQDPTAIQNLEENDLEVNILNSEMPAFNFTQKSDNQIEPINLCEVVYHDNEVNNLNMDKEKTIQDNIIYLVTGNKKGYISNDSSTYENDILSRYFQTIENVQNLTLNDYPNLSKREQNGKKINQLDENQNDYRPVVDSIEKSPNVIIEEEISSHFRTVQKDQILQMGKSKNFFSSEEYSKERKNVESLKNEDSNLVTHNTQIENGSNFIEVTNNNVINENQNMVIENLNNYDTDKASKDEKIRIEENQIKSNELKIVENNERMSNASNGKRKITENFKLQRRHNFVPKGMSPIFENCNSKNICSYNLETDYFQDDLYNNFANDVLDNIEIYENKVSNISEVPKKINKDPNCLKFNTQSLKDAKVFGQVDRKFIIAELKSENLNMKHMVLFDQHAVHERITLEENLSDYKDDQWNSINCEPLSLKLCNDDVLYLNNFRDKFKQFGLDWKIESDSQITVNAVPKAIFGKYSRQADVIIQSIKNLILEEIKAIKSQGGNTLLYPKSIMNLVFSEACRYAIKFGDKLSRRECAAFISSLSSCRTPFQCAHGRPVLAVLADLKTYDYEYKVDTSKILKLRNKLT